MLLDMTASRRPSHNFLEFEMAGLLTAIWRTVCDVVLFWQTASLALNLPNAQG
jgi:hypothetical protein